MDKQEARLQIDNILGRIDKMLLEMGTIPTSVFGTTIHDMLVEAGLQKDQVDEKADLWASLGAAPEHVRKLFGAGRSVEQAEVLLTCGLSHEEGKLWEDVGFELNTREFNDWFASFDSPDEVIQWHSNGWGVDEAVEWASVGKNADEAKKLKEDGVTPEKVLD